MCLYIFTHLNECATGAGVCLEATAKDCGRLLTSCAKDLGRLTRDLLGVLLLLPGVVLGAVVVAACALLTAVVKLLIGSAFKIDRSVRQYFAVDEAFYEHVVKQEGSCIGHRAGHTALSESEGDWAMGVTWV